MPIFNIFTEHSLGFSHSGEVTCSGNGEVELSEEEVQQLVNLIKENNGETDVEALGLEEKYPDIYEQLDEAFRDAAYHAEYCHWVIAGYENGWYEVDTDETMAKCEEHYGFKFNPEDHKDEDLDEEDMDDDYFEDAKSEAFDEWVEAYRSTLDEEQEVAFLADVFCLEPEIDAVDYEVELPPDIIKMAREGAQ